jgi:hypothetical protein
MMSTRERKPRTSKSAWSRLLGKSALMGAAQKQTANDVRSPMRPLKRESGAAIIELFLTPFLALSPTRHSTTLTGVWTNQRL